MRTTFCALGLLALAAMASAESPPSAAPSSAATGAAEHALAAYGEALVETLGELLAFETVHREGLANAENPEFHAMTAYLERKAEALGLDFEDHGAVVVAEKGWCLAQLLIPPAPATPDSGPLLASFFGGAFASQFPEAAVAVIEGPTP